MPFAPGHKLSGSKNKRKNNSRPSKKQKHQTLDIYKGGKEWDKSPSRRTLDQAEVDHYIYNDLDINELYDDLKLYDYSWKDGSSQKREYMKEYQKKKRDGNKGM